MPGDYETGQLLGRDGKTVFEDPNDLATEWQFREDLDGPMLFGASRHPQFPEKCILPNTAKKESRRALRAESTISRQAAEKACAHRIDNKEGCIHDVIATGDLELAYVGGF